MANLETETDSEIDIEALAKQVRMSAKHLKIEAENLIDSGNLRLARHDVVKLFGAADFLNNLLWTESGHAHEVEDTCISLAGVCEDLFYEAVEPWLEDECPACDTNHADLLLDYETAFCEAARPLLISQQSDGGKLYMALRFLKMANSSVRIEAKGRTSQKGMYTVVHLAAGELSEICTMPSGQNPIMDFAKRHGPAVREWLGNYIAGEADDFPPHIVAASEHYRKWRPEELKWDDRGVDPKWDQHIDSCSGKVKNFHIGDKGFMYRCNLCCYEDGCKAANAVAAAQSEG